MFQTEGEYGAAAQASKQTCFLSTNAFKPILEIKNKKDEPEH